MPRASVAQQKSIRVRHDGGIVCKRSLSRGQCNKLIANNNAEIHCPNGHDVSISDVLCEALNRPDADWNVIKQFGLQGYKIRPFIKRLASAEFLGASRGSWQYDFLLNRLDIFSSVLAHADIFEPECGRVLREYWEHKLPEFWADIGRCLQELKRVDVAKYIRFRERALLAFNRWAIPDPLRYLAWSELSLEVIENDLEVCDERLATLYQHNIDESVRLLRSNERFPVPALLFFTGHRLDKQFGFIAVPDPHQSYQGWFGTSQIQIRLSENKSAGRFVRMDLSIDMQEAELRGNFERRLNEFGEQELARTSPRSKSREERIQTPRYRVEHGHKVEILLPDDVVIDFQNPKFHLKIVQDFMSALFLRIEDLIR